MSFSEGGDCPSDSDAGSGCTGRTFRHYSFLWKNYTVGGQCGGSGGNGKCGTGKDVCKTDQESI